MFTRFFADLRSAGVPVSLREYLTFLDALQASVVLHDPEGFYHLARASLVKDERHIDRFDRVFGTTFAAVIENGPEALLESRTIPDDWVRRLVEKHLTEAEKAEVAALGGFRKLMEALRERLAEQEHRHQGGSKWIGTGGSSPFGAWGYNPEGIRTGQHESRHRRAVKVWDRREFRNFDDSVEIGTRNIKLALRRLRRWAREGVAEELDLPETIRATARQGWLEVVSRPERQNAVKVLLFLDVGGSMDRHVRVVEELFSSARAEFRHLEYFYFHNCIYEGLWRDNRRRDAQVPTAAVMRTYGPDYRAIIVGDAAMSPYELTHPGGASEHSNEETGAVWLERLRHTWPASVWINPLPASVWHRTPTIGMISDIFETRMFPMTLDGLERGIRTLARG